MVNCEISGCRDMTEKEEAGDVALPHPHEARNVVPEYREGDLEHQGQAEAGWNSPSYSSERRNLSFVGYGSPMCMESDGDIGGGGNDLVASPDSSAAPMSVGEATLEGAAWSSIGDCEKLLVEANKPRGARRVEVLGRREARHRRRKVGVAARVADVRGILRCVAFPRTDKTARVSFDTPTGNESLAHWEESPRPPWPQGVPGDDGEQETPFSILEESDADASDSCEMKTIIIRLGSGGDEEGGGDNNGESCGGVSYESASGRNGGRCGGRGGGAFINWRPRHGRNHQALSRRPAERQQPTAPIPASYPSPPNPVQRSSELVILDLLRRNKNQGVQFPPHHSSSEPPLDQIILPPPRQYSPATSQHHSFPQNHIHTEIPSASRTHVPSSSSSSPPSSSSSPRREPSTVEENHHHNHNHLHHYVPSSPLTDTSSPAQHPQASKPEHEVLTPASCQPGPDTDEDTDDGSTTPIEEFFLNHGVRFDATSATSKKL